MKRPSNNKPLKERIPFLSQKGRRTYTFVIDKRQKFVIAVVLLTIGLYISEYQFGKSGLIIALILSVFTDLFLFWAVRGDLKDANAKSIFILPFFL